MPHSDITAIINLHAEGALAVASLRSIAAAKSHAEGQKIAVEVLAVLDSPSADTAEAVRQCSIPNLRSIEVAHRDLGKSRNAGAAAANGEWIGFLDGDDLWSENWLSAAYEFSQHAGLQTILHPKVCIYFGAFQQIYTHVDMDDDDFDVMNLSMSNYWTALAFAKRQTYREIPYPETKLEQQIGYEDWGWHLETIARGYRHKCVPGTLHAIRRREGNLTSRADSARAMPPPTTLFRSKLLN